MEAFEWKDVTSYRRGDQGKIEPRSWEIKNGDFRIVVTRKHHLEGWFLICNAVNFSDVMLDSDSLEGAQREALVLVGERLDSMMLKYRNLVIGAS